MSGRNRVASVVAIGASVAALGALGLAIGCSGGGDDLAGASTTTIDTANRLAGDAITLRSEPRSWTVGDPIPLLIFASSSDGAIASIELPDDGRLGPFEFVVRPAPRLPDLPIGGDVVQLELITFESGDLTVPAIVASFESPVDGAIRVLASAPLAIAVASVLGDAVPQDAPSNPLAALRPLKAPVTMNAASDDDRTFWWITSVLFTSAVLVGVFLVFARRRRPFEPPAAAWARQRLAEIRSSGAPSTPSERWAAAAALLRELLERRDGLQALDRTTAELDHDLDRDPRFDDAERKTIVQLLRQADLAKFAGLAERDSNEALAAIERLVEAGEARDADGPREAAA